MQLIDGSFLEGGGQILRMAIALSAILRQPVKIINIRKNRGVKPGLGYQHLTGLKVVSQLCGVMKGLKLGSSEVEFYPDIIRGSLDVNADIKTAGAVTLLAQIILPCVLFADKPSCLDIRGGTHTFNAPTNEYYSQVFLPNLRRFGVNVSWELLRPGYFPVGGGHVKMKVQPILNTLQPICLVERGRIVSVNIATHADSSEVMAQSALAKLDGMPGLTFETLSFSGSSIIIVAKTSNGCILGASSCGSKKEDPAETGSRTAEQLMRILKVYSSACVDDYCQDQLVLFMAFGSGKSRITTGPLTLHTKTVIHVVEAMTPVKFKINHLNGDDGGCVILECDGLGSKRLIC